MVENKQTPNPRPGHATWQSLAASPRKTWRTEIKSRCQSSEPSLQGPETASHAASNTEMAPERMKTGSAREVKRVSAEAFPRTSEVSEAKPQRRVHEEERTTLWRDDGLPRSSQSHNTGFLEIEMCYTSCHGTPRHLVFHFLPIENRLSIKSTEVSKSQETSAKTKGAKGAADENGPGALGLPGGSRMRNQMTEISYFHEKNKQKYQEKAHEHTQLMCIKRYKKLVD